MFKRITLRWRLTIVTAILITIVCIGLTIVLNLSAYRLADSIEAARITMPAQPAPGMSLPDNELFPEEIFPPEINTVQAKQGFRYESILYTLIAVLIGSGFTYYVAGRALKPVKALNEQVKNININNLSETLDVPPTNDELAQLTDSFNGMTDKLHEAFLMQQRFSASAAHELRTPLAVLQTKIDVFCKKNSHEKSDYDALVADMKKQTVRLRSLVGDLLDMTNMDDDERGEFVLRDLLEDIVAELSSVAKNNDISLRLCCDDISVNGNIDLLHRAFYNLVENGIKYNINGGSVEITAHKNNNNTEILIRDTGVGISDEYKIKIFEPFYRVDKSRSREMGGAGLGLSLVDTIIKKHGGSIEVTDNNGGGSCFKINL